MKKSNVVTALARPSSNCRRRVDRLVRHLAIVAAGATLAATLPAVIAAASSRVIIAPSTCPWIAQSQHHQKTSTQLANEVADRMTNEELANFVVLRAGAGVENFNVGVARLCVPPLTLIDGPSGIGNGATGVTQFPSELAVAATFNPTTARQVGYAMGQEALTKGYDVLQAPDLNLIRTPLSGRAFETYGEDPFLASVMGVAAIEGIQSTGVMAQAKHLGAYTQENGRARLDQMVSARTLAEVYNAPFRAAVQQGHVASIMCAMGSINVVNTCSSSRLFATLRSWGFHGFVRTDYSAVLAPAPALRAGVSLVKPATSAQVMGALQHRWLDTAALRRGVRAVLAAMFSYGLFNNTRQLTTSARATSNAHVQVALRAARQGIVLLKDSSHVLPLSAKVSVAVIGVDAFQGVVTRGGGSSGVHASRLETPLHALHRLLPGTLITYSPGGPNGLEFDPLKTTDITGGKAPPSELPITAPGEPGKGDVAIDYAKSVSLAALTATSPGTGEGWSSWAVSFRAEKTGTYVVGIEDDGDTWLSVNGTVVLSDRGLHGPYPQSTSLQLIAGHTYRVSARWFSIKATTEPRFGIEYAQLKINVAVAAAKKARVAVVFASNLLSEGADLGTLSLQGDLNALISAVAAVNPRTIVVLNTGGPITMPWKSQVAGIVEAWYAGQMASPAMAQVLAGAVDPSGRLPVTMPGSTWQTPASSPRQYPGHNGVVDFAGLSALGYRWYQANAVTPSYPFGYGLSYTTFSWTRIRMTPASGGVAISLDVTNTGSRSGVSVVQVYVGYPSVLGEPPAQLRGIARVDLARGASKSVTLTLSPSAFTSYNGHSLVVAKGTYSVNVATSSADFVASQSVNFA